MFSLNNIMGFDWSALFQKGQSFIFETLNIPSYEEEQKTQQKKKQEALHKRLMLDLQQHHEDKAKAKVRVNKAKVLSQIETLGGGLSQGFNLISKQKLDSTISHYNVLRNNSSFVNGEDKTLELMYNCLKNDSYLTQYLDKQYQDEVNSGVTKRQLSYGAKRQLSNIRLKAKQLFILYRNFIDAQVELLSFADDVAKVCNGTVTKPPGAFQGTKSFNGALQKVTIRERSSDVGNLKDCARATIVFDSLADLTRAKNSVVSSSAFQAVKNHQKALKDRYDTGTGELSRFNSGAQKSGYRDIKFFIKLPESDTVAELQLNTKYMAFAKEKEHVIYEILRATKNPEGPFTINNLDILNGVKKEMTSKWFTEVKHSTQNLNLEILALQKMMENLAKSNFKQLNVTKEQASALLKVANGLYSHAMKSAA